MTHLKPLSQDNRRGMRQFLPAEHGPLRPGNHSAFHGFNHPPTGKAGMVPAPESKPAAARIHVLAVEDDVLLRAVLADQLREAGLTVVEAGNADEAMAYLNSGGPVDLVFSDIEMPGSMSGLELARKIRAQHSSLPIILTSGRRIPGEQNGGLAAFIPKPYDVARAVSMVLATLGLLRPDG